MDMNNLSLTITMPEDTSREEAVRLADEVLERVMTVDDVQEDVYKRQGFCKGYPSRAAASSGVRPGWGARVTP